MENVSSFVVRVWYLYYDFKYDNEVFRKMYGIIDKNVPGKRNQDLEKGFFMKCEKILGKFSWFMVGFFIFAICILVLLDSSGPGLFQNFEKLTHSCL